jgi:hypothetical protein
MSKVGGTGDVKQVDDHARQAVHAVKSDVETRTNKKYDTFEPTTFKSQVVRHIVSHLLINYRLQEPTISLKFTLATMSTFT